MSLKFYEGFLMYDFQDYKFWQYFLSADFAGDIETTAESSVHSSIKGRRDIETTTGYQLKVQVGMACVRLSACVCQWRNALTCYMFELLKIETAYMYF